MFGLAEFWSRDLDDEVQLVGSEIREGLKSRGETASKANVHRELEELAKCKRDRIWPKTPSPSSHPISTITFSQRHRCWLKSCGRASKAPEVCISTSEIKIAVTVDETRIEDAARAVHDAFQLDKVPV